MTPTSFNDTDFKSLIGNLLRYGVWISLSVSVLGGIVYLIEDSSKIADYSSFVQKDQNLLEVVTELLMGATQFQGPSLVFLGIILLFLTPILRMIVSLISFAAERDWLYVGICILVLGIISGSAILGFAH